ncbi:MAG: M23 family metallopeptidase [Bacteroidaceae bacterium]|nr:M23 family metallopeptidase [Bacteroidaceae bacterium]
MKVKGFRNRLLRKYRLTIHNENKLENVLGFYISPLWVIMSLFFSFLLVAGVLYLIVVFTPVGNLLPGYISDRAKEELIMNNIRIDSLTKEVEKQDRYIANIRTLLNGGVAVDPTRSTPIPMNTDTIVTDKSIHEREFMEKWEERERHNLTSQATSVAEVQELHLVRPTRGEITKGFDPGSGHYGVDIAEIPGESVMAIHDGVVVMSDFTANEGFTIAIQHKENMISIYRNCYRLLKSIGDKVSGGEVIGTLSSGTDSGETKRKDYLHLELWHRGQALDPSTYIAF